MFLHEWYKLWHNRKLLGFLIALLLVNALYFWYHSERDIAPAHAYRALTADLRGLGDAEAADAVAQMQQEASAYSYRSPLRESIRGMLSREKARRPVWVS